MISRLHAILKNRKTFAIAFSGGVDSTFLAAAAKKVCGDEVVALTAVSRFQSQYDLTMSLDIAETIGIKQVLVEVDVMIDPTIVVNSIERCYFCKQKLFEALRIKAKELGFDILAHGANMDDLNDYRPGLKAAEEMGIFSPLVEAQLTKSDIRIASKAMGLCTWDMPSQSCLATRIPYGETITVEKLNRIECCEYFLIQLGFYGVRVRCHSNMARIECPNHFISQMAQHDMCNKITSFFTTQGFRFVALDLAGYRSGNMN
ncbi:MAG: ATP-dependent sacrificial sulfur transferase LarE [Desulfamplus sp.]|nr:ATP-dependent sacrificial sulfur transferase LarE [Desulfamplus sp.]